MEAVLALAEPRDAVGDDLPQVRRPHSGLALLSPLAEDFLDGVKNALGGLDNRHFLGGALGCWLLGARPLFCPGFRRARSLGHNCGSGLGGALRLWLGPRGQTWAIGNRLASSDLACASRCTQRSPSGASDPRVLWGSACLLQEAAVRDELVRHLSQDVGDIVRANDYDVLAPQLRQAHQGQHVLVTADDDEYRDVGHHVQEVNEIGHDGGVREALPTCALVRRLHLETESGSVDGLHSGPIDIKTVARDLPLGIGASDEDGAEFLDALDDATDVGGSAAHVGGDADH